MRDDNEIIVEVWEVIRDVVPVAKREDAALRLLKVFEENGFDINEIEGEDSILDEALILLRDEEDGEDETEELNF
jgi:hypothetical protein